MIIKKKMAMRARFVLYIALYYIDKSVLVENRPLVRFIRNYIRNSSGVFSISSLVRKKQYFTIFYSLAPLVRKILFLPLENNIQIFVSPCNILHICSGAIIDYGP